MEPGMAKEVFEVRSPEEIRKGLECCGNSGECKGCPYYGGYELCMGTLAEDALTYIQQLEAQVRHGKWIKGGYACGEYEWKCSVCGATDWRGSADWMKFCMYCGAKMDGSEEE